jgi:hypothetical protein
MKKIILFSLLATVALARVESDVALTWGHNSLNDDQVLFGSAAFYGVRAGTTVDDTYGAQIGYEQTRAANCQGLTLRRYYVNGVVQTRLESGIKPYALATLGYETSSKDYRPSQTFMGLGGGLKYNFTEHANVFLETRALKSMDTKDVTWATTLGLGYAFNTAPLLQKQESSQKIVPKELQSRPRVTTPVHIAKRVVPVQTNVFYADEEIQALGGSKGLKDGYYVQIAALSSSSPSSYIKKLNRHGFHNVSVKRVKTRKLVVVGPYESRSSATRVLRELKSISSGAFIKRF